MKSAFDERGDIHSLSRKIASSIEAKVSRLATQVSQKRNDNTSTFRYDVYLFQESL